jgi:signal peptidase I
VVTDEQSADQPADQLADQPATGDPPDRDPSQRSGGAFWRELLILVGVAVVVALLVRVFLLQTFYIPSVSMQHTFEIDDRVLVNKMVYHFREPARGEIVVFEAPLEWRSNIEDKDFIKRVIGVGGDRIVCCDERQRLIINGQSLDEPYLFAQGGVSDVAAAEPFELTVPEGRLWLLGDHRSSSGDSMDHFQRSGGDLQAATVDQDAVIGRAFVLFWPPGRATWLSVPGSFDAVPAAPPERAPAVPAQPGD